MIINCKKLLRALELPDYYIPDFSVIKSQYRKLSYSKHPDHGGTKDAFQDFQDAVKDFFIDIRSNTERLQKHQETKKYYDDALLSAVKSEFNDLPIDPSTVSQDQQTFAETLYAMGIDLHWSGE